MRSLTESGLLSGETLRAALDAPGPDHADGDALAGHLVRSGHLTSFQSDAVRRGRFDELFVGNYVVLDRIGAGGMGTVFKARHRRMKRVVALKVLSREAAGRASFARRFQREVETIAQLSHPNVVMAYDADEVEAGPFLVMEYIDGRDLRIEIEHGGPLSVAEAVECTIQAARGLEYAHGLGFIHRDVKPANLLRDAQGTTKVADLGLARLGVPEAGEIGAVTLAGNVVGTAEYMSPEQAEDSSATDSTADLYALGCTLFFLLAGRAPYSASSLMGLLLKHRDAPIPSLREHRPGRAPGFRCDLFRRMVAKRPAGTDSASRCNHEVIAALEGVRGMTDALDVRPGGGSMGPDASSMGEATAEVDPVKPATLTMTLPSEPTPDMEAMPSTSEVRRVAELVVVLVEPSRLQARIVRDYLRQLGIERVSRTDAGERALTMVRREGADVLLCAMHLADMTGADLARALRGDPECARGRLRPRLGRVGGRTIEASTSSPRGWPC